MPPRLRHHTIIEYGVIAPSENEHKSENELYIKKQDYIHLEDFVLRNTDETESEGREFFSLTHKKGVGRCIQDILVSIVLIIIEVMTRKTGIFKTDHKILSVIYL